MKREQPQRIALYLVVAFGFSALCWLVAMFMALKQNLLLPTAANFFTLLEQGFADASHLFWALLFAGATFGPLVAAVIASGLESGRDGVRALWSRVFNWSVAGRWCIAMLLIALAITLLPSLLALAVGTSATELFTLVPWYFYLLLFLFQFATSGLGEETGWRGYLQPALFARYSGPKAIWLTGLAWAIWHYPFVLFLFISSAPEMPLAQLAITLLMSVAGFTMTIIGQSFIYAWLLNHSHSVFLAILYHALGNTLATVLGAEALAAGPFVLLPALAPWAVVIILEKRFGKESFYPA